MATPPEIQKLLDRLEAAYKKLGEANPFKNFNTSAFNDINDAISVLNDGLSSVNEKLSYLDDDLSKISAGFKSIVDSLKTQNQALNLTTRSYNNLSSLAQKLKNDQTGISELNKKDLENLKKKAYEERANLATAKELLENKKRENTITNKEKDALNEINAVLQGQDGLFRSLIANTNKRIFQEEKINKLMGLGGAAVEGTQKALNKMGFGGLSNALGLDEVKKKMRETAEEIEKSDGNANSFANKFKVLRGGIKEAGQQLMTSLRDPLVVVGFLVDQMVDALQKADTQTGQLAKAFGTSYSEAASMRNELNTVANLSGDINITTGALQESLIAVNKEFGTATMFSGELLTDFTNMTKVMGYTDEAAAKLSKITVATGTDLSNNTAQILGTAAAFNVTNDLALNEKEIVEGVAKASAATTVSLGMQPGKIAAAVVQAKALGLELNQVEGIAESLLNFESSISNELEAELLTGRALNLEQARYLALTNDIEGVAKEIAKQGITATEFTGMNMIQQKAIAEAVGMTREELAQSLINQQALTNLGGKDKTLVEAYNRLKKEGLSDTEIQARLGKDIQADQLKSQSIQERFNASVEKLQELFVSLAEPILQVVSPFMDLATTILPLINVVLTPITFTLQKIGDGFQNAFRISKAIIDPTKTILDTFKELGVLGSILGGIFTIIALPIEAISNGFENISKIINSIMDPTKTLLDTFKEMGPISSFIATALGTAGIAVTTVLLPGLIRSAIAAVAALGPMIATAMAAVSTAVASTLGVGALPIIAGIATVAGAVAAVTSIKDGEIDYQKGVVVSGGFGSVQLDGKDTFVGDKNGIKAGTNLFGNTAQSTSPSISVNITPLVNEMQAVKAVLVQMLNKDSNVYLDGAKVGRGISMASSKIG